MSKKVKCTNKGVAERVPTSETALVEVAERSPTRGAYRYFALRP